MSRYAFSAAKRRTRLGNLIAGVGTLASIWPTVTVATRYPNRTDFEALRSDGEQIGADMRRVIDRERARVQTSQG